MPHEVIVTGSATALAQRIETGRHVLTADEPEEAGGRDTGPTPYELLAAALGSCTSMTIAMVARRRGWQLESVTVRVRHTRIHARDCESCETKEGRLDQLERVIELTGELTDEQRSDLLRIAERCPVHRTLAAEILLPTRLAPVEH